MRSPLVGATLARAMGQAVTAWAVGLHLLSPGQASPFVVVFAVVALAVTLRRAPSFRSHAAACFGAAMLATGVVSGWLADSGLLLLTGSGRLEIPVSYLLLTVAAVLYGMSGAFFWLLREDS